MTILSKAPNAEIAGISRRERNGQVIYEIEFKGRGTNSTLQVDHHGTLIQDLQQKAAEPVTPMPAP